MLGSFKVWAFIVKTGSHIGLLFRAQLRIQLRIQHQQLCWLFVFLCNASVRLMWILCRFKGKLTCKLTEQFTCRIVDGHMVKWRHKKVLQISRVRCYIVMLTPAFIYWKQNKKKSQKYFQNKLHSHGRIQRFGIGWHLLIMGRGCTHKQARGLVSFQFNNMML